LTTPRGHTTQCTNKGSNVGGGCFWYGIKVRVTSRKVGAPG
jgi:hypothetical protein